MMLAKLIGITGFLGIAGYVGNTVMNYDPAVFPYSKEQIEQMLVDAKSVVPRRDGDGEIEIWSSSLSDKGVNLNMTPWEGGPVSKCKAVITPITPNKSRVIADCGDRGDSGSAIARTERAIGSPMFGEHIQATLNKREFNRKNVDEKQMGIIMRNMGGMQREALRRSDEAHQMSTSSQ